MVAVRRMASPHDAIGAYRGATVAVLGASGFIGRWVARALIASGATVVLVARRAASIHRALVAEQRVTVREADLASASAVRDAVTGIRPAIVFNLAGYGVDRDERHEEPARAINAGLPGWIAEAMADVPAERWRGQRVVHAGSALEYGEIGGDLNEASHPHPTTLYGRTKLAGTLALRDTCASAGIRGLTARLFTVYGAGEHRGRLLPTLLEARRSEERIPLSAGLQRRDFTYVEDVAGGLVRLGTLATPAPGEIINLASGMLTEVRAFVLEAAGVLGIATGRLDFGALPTRTEEMQHDPVSVRRLRALLADGVPGTPIREGVRRAANHADADAVTGA
jgi:nucleoside-diphosphate-sugar epimerase